MKHANNFIVIALALLLSYVNIYAGSYASNLAFSDQESKIPQPAEYQFKDNINLFTVLQSKENISNLLENFQTFSIKKIISNTNRFFAIEHELICLAVKYIQFSSNITLSAATEDLIYPFNYFW